MASREELLRKVDAVIATLAVLPAAEKQIGWDDQRAQKWLKVFGRLRDALTTGKSLRPEYENVIFVRGMDFDGICGGGIFDLAADVGCDLVDLIKEETVSVSRPSDARQLSAANASVARTAHRATATEFVRGCEQLFNETREFALSFHYGSESVDRDRDILERNRFIELCESLAPLWGQRDMLGQGADRVASVNRALSTVMGVAQSIMGDELATKCSFSQRMRDFAPELAAAASFGEAVVRRYLNDAEKNMK